MYTWSVYRYRLPADTAQLICMRIQHHTNSRLLYLLYTPFAYSYSIHTSCALEVVLCVAYRLQQLHLACCAAEHWTRQVVNAGMCHLLIRKACRLTCAQVVDARAD